jgi:hypothetical protein
MGAHADKAIAIGREYVDPKVGGLVTTRLPAASHHSAGTGDGRHLATGGPFVTDASCLAR